MIVDKLYFCNNNKVKVMKKLGIILLLATGLNACGNVDEQKAAEHLKQAEKALSAQQFSEAKLQVDSIRVLYPKAFESRKKGIRLLQQADLQEQQKSLVYLDSMRMVKQAQFDSIKGRFVLEKDTAYQETGNYFYPAQTVERNIGRTFLRAQVSERGEMSITSIYCAGGSIHHTAVKVSDGDESAETPPSDDRYETTDLGRPIEKVDYKLGADGGVVAFVLQHADKNIRLQFNGDRTYRTVMPVSDRKAIVELSRLARILSGMEEIEKAQKEARLKIDFVKRKMEENKD